MPDRPVLIAGSGIAGLTAALAFAAKGRPVTLVERAPRLEEAGAGLQVSPNASRILFGLGIRSELLLASGHPEAVRLIDARTLRPIAAVPLGDAAEARWGAPYLVLHRADLQRVLLDRVRRTAAIRLLLDTPIESCRPRASGGLDVRAGGRDFGAALLVGADGVGSQVRKAVRGATPPAPTGMTAWRTTLSRDDAQRRSLGSLLSPTAVSAFLHPLVHLVAYPLRGGRSFNLVAVARDDRRSAGAAPAAGLADAFKNAAAPLAALAADGRIWTGWPLTSVPASGPYLGAGPVALIGDAAHAMTPFAAQGAAMAIEDAATLAEAWSRGGAASLPGWERDRRARLARVRRRGALNRLTWHASGPIRIGRDLVLGLRSPERLAADLDWLYGWRPAPSG